MAWTDERVDQLRKLWIEGLSASQIAAELGGVTRNAVIGKIHRLGLSGRAKTNTGGAARRKSAAPRTPSAPKTIKSANTARASNALATIQRPAAPEPDVEKPKMRMIGLLQLTEQTCKFPVGDPQEDDFAFCGVNAREGDPYCEYHCRIAYQPAAERRQKSAQANRTSNAGFRA